MRAVEILYQNPQFIILNKPPGISVHGGDSVQGLTVVDFLLEQFPEIRGVGENLLRSTHFERGSLNAIERPGIVHRLDRDTSGVMVVARTQESFLLLKELFQNRRIEKIYHAIVCGRVFKMQGIIRAPVGRLQKNPTRRGVAGERALVRGARDAVTDYKVLKQGTAYSLVELHPRTGRMHQLRVHVKSIGHPIACDRIYGGKNVCCPAGTGRQLLHARSLSFSISEGSRFYFEADPPADFLIAEKYIV